MVMKKGIVLAFGVIVLASCESKEEKAFKASIESRIASNESALKFYENKKDSIRPYYLEDLTHGTYPGSGYIYKASENLIREAEFQIETDKKYLYK